jgi:hypothetical protein
MVPPPTFVVSKRPMKSSAESERALHGIYTLQSASRYVLKALFGGM